MDMEPAALLQYITLFIAACFLLSRLHFSGQKKCKFPPSPPALPIIGHLHLLKPPRHLSIINIAARYGGLVFLRLGSRNAIIVSSPSALEEVFSLNDRAFSNHPQLHAGKYLLYGGISMFSSPYGTHWRNLRRLTSADLLSITRISQYAAILTEELLCHVRSMARTAAATEDKVGDVPLMVKMFDMAYSAMLRIVTGKRCFGDGAPEADVETAKEIKEIFEEGLELLYGFNPRDFFPALGWMDLMKVQKRIERLTQQRDSTMNHLLEENKRKKMEEAGGHVNEKLPFIDLMLSLQETTDREWLTDEVIHSQIYVS